MAFANSLSNYVYRGNSLSRRIVSLCLHNRAGGETVLARLAAGVTGELALTAAAGGEVDSLSAVIVLNIKRAVMQRVRVVRKFLEKEALTIWESGLNSTQPALLL